MPLALARAFEERNGVSMLHAWGMTETSPVCTVARAPAGLSAEQEWEIRATQGRRAVRRAPPRGLRREVPWDGRSTGEIECADRGSRAATTGEEAPEKFDRGWLRTGDIARVDPAAG